MKYLILLSVLLISLKSEAQEIRNPNSLKLQSVEIYSLSFGVMCARYSLGYDEIFESAVKNYPENGKNLLFLDTITNERKLVKIMEKINTNSCLYNEIHNNKKKCKESSNTTL